MHEKYRYKFDAVSIIEDLGGAPETARILSEAGAEVHMKAVQKMRERGMMQSDVIATLLVGASRKGIPFDPYKYILERLDQ